MKGAVAVALIVCGTLLILAPASFDHLLVRNRNQVLVSRPEVISVSGGEPISAVYRLVCWAAGAGMVGIAVLNSIPRRLPANVDPG